MLLSLLTAAGCSRKIDDGLTKFPVTGTVNVDGQPAQGVVLRFFRDGKPGETNADSPLAVTDANGKFALSTNGNGDGAVPGTFQVTFTWKESNDPGARDRLGGRYTRLEQSKIEVTIKPEPQELPPFELVGAPAGKASSSASSKRRPRAGGQPSQSVRK